MKRRNINAADATLPVGGGYANAVEISQFKRVVFVSGQIPVDIQGAGSVRVRRAMPPRLGQCESTIARRGHDDRQFVKVTTYLADRAYGMENRVARKEALGDLCPASTTIVADIFDAAWLVEIEVIAAA